MSSKNVVRFWCLKQCGSALIVTVLLQYLLLILFMLIVNIHVFHPILWLRETLSILTSSYSWFMFVPVVISITLHGSLLARVLLNVRFYYLSRFQWFMNTMPRKLGLLSTNMLVGLLTVWFYSRHLHEDYRTLTFQCSSETNCINSRYIFLLSAGLMAGFYHFIKYNFRQDPEIQFPIVQELLLVRVRSLLYTTLCRTLLNSFLPTVMFAFCYWLLGGVLQWRIAIFFGVQGYDDSLDTFMAIAGNMRLLLYTWILYSHILSCLHLLEQLLSIFLTVEWDLPIIKEKITPNGPGITLVEGLAMSRIPVVQQQAAWNFQKISHMYAAKERADIFKISKPGGQPYNWNDLSTQSLAMLNAFIEELSKSIGNISAPVLTKINPNVDVLAQRTLLRQFNDSIGMRRLASDPVATTPAPIHKAVQAHKTNLDQWLAQLQASWWRMLDSIPGFHYLFGKQTCAEVCFLLASSNIIVWLVQGLAGISRASLVEDKYGVVQTNLAEIIKAILRLKMEIQKISNIAIPGKNSVRDYSILRNGVKRSLYEICDGFKDYIRDFIDDAEVVRNLQPFLNYQET